MYYLLWHGHGTIRNGLTSWVDYDPQTTPPQQGAIFWYNGGKWLIMIMRGHFAFDQYEITGVKIKQ